MRWKAIALISGALSLWHGNPAAASSYGGNCVLYARSVTGVDLDGNAGAWWTRAEGRYARGHEPAPGAVLVFRPYAGMRVGHVAVVSRVVNRREILVDQANWVRGRIVQNMSVIDASANNDWTSVRVIELHSGTHGRENPTYGFIYPRAARQQPRQETQGDRVVAAPAALPVRLAVARSAPEPRKAVAVHESARHAPRSHDRSHDEAAPRRVAATTSKPERRRAD